MTNGVVHLYHAQFAKSKWWCDATIGGEMPETMTQNDANEQTKNEANDTQSFADFSSWLATQPDNIRAAIDEHIRGLKSALTAEREQRRTFERQLREAAAKMAADSEARRALDEHVQRLSVMERQSRFYEDAHVHGCTNLRLAFIAATDAGLVRDDGTADWDAVRTRFPELFGGPRNAGRAFGGDGHNAMPTVADMNAFIRSAAGRR